MYNRILVPVDGSTFTEAAIPYALAIATTTGSGLSFDAVEKIGPSAR